MKKLKSEIKRLRQELIMNPKKHAHQSDDSYDALTEEERAALKMLMPEQRKMF
jgi:hypothetical protein